MRSTLPLLLMIIGSLFMLCACATDPTQGYSFSSTFDESIRSVSIPIFRNETTSRGIETQLTDSIIQNVQSRTPWHLSESDRADTTLIGVITSTSLSVLSDDPQTGLVQEQALRVTIRFEWRDNRSGDILLARDGYAASAVFSPSRNVGDRIDVGYRSAIEQLAYDLVSDMRSSW